jgi:HEAT repeat protein
VPKSHALEDRLAALGDLRRDPGSPAARQELAKCLAHKINLLAAKAARIIGECKVDELGSQMVEAFERFLNHGETTDRRCEAKIAIVKALEQIEYPDHQPFLKGIHCVQMEPGYGRAVDTAVEVRATSAVGLVRTNYPDVGIELVRLLADKEREARIGAVRAIAYWGTPAGALLLRFKALAGDEEPDVLGECFNALLYLDPDSLEFVAGFLSHANDAVAEGAALAIGESHREEAFEILKSHERSPIRPAILLAIGLLRQDTAIEYLLQLLPEKVAVAALDIYKDDTAIQERIRMATHGE